MSAKFKMDPNWEKNLRKAVQPAMDRTQDGINGVLAQSAGKSVDTVTDELMQAVAAAGVKPNRADLRKIAERHLAG